MDNTELNAGSGGDVLRTEDRTTFKTPVSLIDVGGTSAESILGDAGVTLPVGGLSAHDAAVSGNPILVGAEFDDTLPDSVDEGDIGRLRISANRNLYVTIRDAAGNERGLNVDASGNIGVTDAGGILTVDGTVNAAQSGTWNITNISGTISLPTGAATAANQSTANTALAAIQTAVETLDNAISGTEMQVDVLTLPRLTVTNVGGTAELLTSFNSSGALDVYVVGGQPTPAVGNVAHDSIGTTTNPLLMGGYASAAAPTSVSADGDAVRSWHLRNGAQATVITAAGALIGGDASNGLDVDVTRVSGNVTVVNSGTFAVQVDGSALTALQRIDDPVFADDEAFTLASSKVMMVGAIRDDALSTLTAVEGDAVPLRVSSTGALHVTGAGGGTQYNVDDASGATDTGTLLLAIRDDSLTTLTPVDGDYVGLRVSSTGALHVTGGGGGTEYNEDDATPATITGTATMMERDDALGALTPIEGDWAAMRCSANGALWVAVDGTVTVGSHAVTNAGTFAVQVDGTALTRLTDIETNTDFGAVTGGGVEASALRVTIASDSTGVVSVDDNGSSLTVDVPAVATGGATPGKLISAATTNATSVKGSAGTLYSLQVFNTNAAARYLKLYNKATAPTVGTDTPVQVFTIPGNTAGAGLVVPIPTCGIAFDTGIALATTTGAADSDTGAVAANEIVVSYSYK